MFHFGTPTPNAISQILISRTTKSGPEKPQGKESTYQGTYTPETEGPWRSQIPHSLPLLKHPTDGSLSVSRDMRLITREALSG